MGELYTYFALAYIDGRRYRLAEAGYIGFLNYHFLKVKRLILLGVMLPKFVWFNGGRNSVGEQLVVAPAVSADLCCEGSFRMGFVEQTNECLVSLL